MSRLYDLHDGYRHDAVSARCARCSHQRIANAVKVAMTPANKAFFKGLYRCGLIWECPLCQARLKANYAKDVQAVVEGHTDRYGRRTAWMLSLTVRHGLHHSMRPVRKGVRNAWRKMQAGRAWQRFKSIFGIVGTVSALEAPFGPNGWHPHLHIVFFTRRDYHHAVGRWLARRWARVVEQVLGAEHTPALSYGAQITICRDGNYLAKLGLELADPGAKRGRWDSHGGHHRTPLEILADYVETGDLDDLKLYRSFVVAMKGARMLTWSRGLKALYGVADKTDEEIVNGDEEHTNCALIAADEWDLLKRIRGARATIKEAAERYGSEGVFAAVDTYVSYLTGRTPRQGAHRRLTQAEIWVTITAHARGGML